MKKLLSWLFNRWTLLGVLLVALAAVVWIVGPMVSIGTVQPLDSEAARWWTIAALVAAAALRIAWGAWRARRGNAAVIRQMSAAAPAEAQAAESPDLAAVRQRFEQAMQLLREARFGAGGRLVGWRARLDGRYLYQLPWYLIVGAPGSGKTTALHHCGLNFPLASRLGDRAVHGVHGTRQCDWWFTDRAVIIDTAGRFMTQDSHRDDDGATWSGFLAMLKRSRPRQPINGVLVTVPVDLLLQGPAARADYAAKVRARMQELHARLDVRFPVYLLVTKADLLAGFTDTFATLDKEQRIAPWGTTFDVAADSASNLARLGDELGLLVARLNAGLVERLQAETDTLRRARIFGFPTQVAHLQGLLQDFAEAAFAPSRFEADPWLRGVYFVSGTQEGTPIDRVLGAAAHAFRLEGAAVAAQSASGRSFFLQRLLGDVIFAESGLAGTNRRRERRLRLATAGAYAAVGLLSAGLLAGWGVSYVNNRQYVADVQARADQVGKVVLAAPTRASPELLPLVPALDATRDLARSAAAEAPRLRGLGLSQVDTLDGAARQAYRAMLVDAVLPRLDLRVQDQLRQAGDSGSSRYEALKAYVMLHEGRHFDPVALKRYFGSDWDAQSGRALPEAERRNLDSHLHELLAQGAMVSPLKPQTELVDFHRRRLAAMPLPERIRERLRQQGLGQDFPEFNAVAAAGDRIGLILERASGAPLTRGVPGGFTKAGYWKGFDAQVPRVAEALAREQPWVLGVPAPPAPAPGAPDTLADDVRRLYLAEYATAWDTYLADLRLRPMTTMTQSIQMAQLLADPDGPLPRLLKAVSEQTTLLDGAGRGFMENAADIARRKVPQVLPAAGPRPEQLVDERFAKLREMVTAPKGAKPPLDETIALMRQVQALLVQVDNALKGGIAVPASDLPTQVRVKATQSPPPLRGMMEALADTSGHLTQVVMRGRLAADVKAQVGEFCQQALAGRYPLDRNGRDATPADFAAVFAPGGRIDQLFQQKLAAYVDTSARPSWRFRDGEAGPLGSDAGTLPQFQRAQAIRETFFPAGSSAPALKLVFTPAEMDASIRQFVIDVDGQVVRYDHGPPIPVQVQWPGPRNSGLVSVQVSPPSPSGRSGLNETGPWALMRLFDRVRIEPGGSPERFRAVFDIDGRKAVFDVTASSVRNPFRLPELAEFRCPTGL